jgi:hypothetical protein
MRKKENNVKRKKELPKSKLWSSRNKENWKRRRRRDIDLNVRLENQRNKKRRDF